MWTCKSTDQQLVSSSGERHEGAKGSHHYVEIHGYTLSTMPAFIAHAQHCIIYRINNKKPTVLVESGVMDERMSRQNAMIQ